MKYFLLIVTFFSSFSYANITTYNDVPYFTYTHDGYKYIFPKEHQKYLKKVVELNHSLRALYEKTYDWQLDEDTSLVLVSTKNQTSNAFATVIPNNLTTFYSGGPKLIDSMSTQSWLDTLIYHETAHLYQLNVKPPFSSFLKSIFGNQNPFNFFDIFPYMVHPNVFAPSMMTEGNAVLQESLFKNGGRLHNGENLALVLSLAAADKITKKRLINDHMLFPYGREKYIVGGFFNAFLAEKYGVKKTNSYFKNQASHFINPFLLEKAFEETFEKDFSTLLKEFNEEYQAKATKAKWSKALPFSDSVFFSPFVEHNNKIYFISYNSGINPPHIYEIDKSTQNISTQETSLSGGMLFFKDNKPYVAKISNISVSEVKASLFDEDNFDLEDYRNKLLIAKNDNTELAFDVSQSFDEPKLLKNNLPIEGSCHSRALIGKDNSYYCFKIKNEMLQFVKDDQTLFEFKGFYGHPVSLADNQFAFIASTEHGTGLFRWENNAFTRLHPSDKIVDAKFLNNDNIVIAEISSAGYHYKLDKIQESESQPYTREYNLPDTEGYKNISRKDIAINDQEIKSYISPLEMRFSSFTPSVFSTNNSTYYSLPFTFIDPLMYNALVVAAGFDANSTDYLVNYSFLKYSVQFNLLYYNDQTPRYDTTTGTYNYTTNDSHSYLGVSWNIFSQGRHSVNFATNVGAEMLEDIDQVKTKNEVTAANLSYVYNYNLGIGYQPHRTYAVSVGYKDTKNVTENTKEPAAYLLSHNHWHLIEDFYTTFNVKAVTSLSSEAKASLVYNPTSLYNSSTSVSRITAGEQVDYYDIGKVNLTLTKAITGSNILTEWFPLGVRRFALLATGNYIYTTLDEKRTQNAAMTEYGWGMNAELLFAHQFPFFIQIIIAKNDLKEGQGDFTTIVELSSEF